MDFIFDLESSSSVLITFLIVIQYLATRNLREEEFVLQYVMMKSNMVWKARWQGWEVTGHIEQVVKIFSEQEVEPVYKTSRPITFIFQRGSTALINITNRQVPNILSLGIMGGHFMFKPP